MEDLTPKEIAETLTNKISEYKFKNKISNIFVMGLLAGAYVAFGGLVCNMILHDSAHYLGYGISKYLGGASFSIALILVIITGAELFTGNTLMITGRLSGKGSWKELLERWTIVFTANLLGAIFIAYLYYLTDLWKTNDLEVGINALKTANAKVNLTFGVILVRAILANWLVCLAVYLSIASKNIIGKIIGIVIPVATFVALGFEHSIANMYFIPMGIFLKDSAAAIQSGLDLTNLTWIGFIQNLIPATLGNLVGGAIFVGFAYWFVYMRESKSKQ